jgi:hypothetical protein
MKINMRLAKTKEDSQPITGDMYTRVPVKLFARLIESSSFAIPAPKTTTFVFI